METCMDANNKWLFPEQITFEMVAGYSSEIDLEKIEKDVTFDLSKTLNIHSSFAGFLIHVKNSLEIRGQNMVLHLSDAVREKLEMLGLLHFFSTQIETNSGRRTA